MKLENILSNSIENSYADVDTQILHNNLKLERNFKLMSYRDIIAVPACVFPQFREYCFNSAHLNITLEYTGSLYLDNSYRPKNLVEGETLYKNVIIGNIFQNNNTHYGYLTPIYEGSNLIYNSSAGYLELVEGRTVTPVLISSLICRVSLENERVMIYPFGSALYINSNLLDHPRIKAFIPKLLKANTKAYTMLGSDNSYNNVNFSIFDNAPKLIFKGIHSLESVDNTLSVQEDGLLNLEAIKEFSEWICS